MNLRSENEKETNQKIPYIVFTIFQSDSLASLFSSSLKKKEEEIEARNKNKEGSNNLEKQKR